MLPCPLQAHIYSSYFFPFFVHSAASEHSSFKSFSFLLVSFLLAWVYPWAARSSMVHVPTMGSPWVPDSGGLHLPQHFVPFLKYISLVPTRGQEHSQMCHRLLIFVKYFITDTKYLRMAKLLCMLCDIEYS